MTHDEIRAVVRNGNVGSVAFLVKPAAILTLMATGMVGLTDQIIDAGFFYSGVALAIMALPVVLCATCAVVPVLLCAAYAGARKLSG